MKRKFYKVVKENLLSKKDLFIFTILESVNDLDIGKNIFHKAYDKTLNKDNRFVMIQDKKGKSNFALFNHIVSGELLTQELALTSQF